MKGPTKPVNFSRPSLLMLAILCYKFDGTLCSEKGSARTYLYETLYNLFPDAFGQRAGPDVRHRKESVLRKMRDKGLVSLTPAAGTITHTITVNAAGSRHLRLGLKDERYHDELILIRDYFMGDGQQPKPMVTDPPAAQPLKDFLTTKVVEVLEEVAEVEVVTPEEEMPEIAIAPTWDHDPISERVGWAILSALEIWHVVGDDMADLSNAINDVEEVRAIYPLNVKNALPPQG